LANSLDQLRSNLKKSKVTFGSWITMADPMVSEILCQAGFDWLAVDMEHSALTLPQTQDHVRIIQLSGLPALVRVEENNPNIIKRVMDTGADGVIVPMVNSRAEAEKAVNAVRYPPVGTRGVGLARAQGYGLNFPEYKKSVGKKLVIIQIEHIKAVENLEDILTVPGIDAFLVGPYDLSGSLGLPGQFDHPKVSAALKRIMKVAKQLNMPAGFHVIPPETGMVQKKIKEGFTFIGYSIDMIFLKTFTQNQLKALKRK
jgi:2-keto-3-deoxy-L-rhamnonate aldolase RhmA